MTTLTFEGTTYRYALTSHARRTMLEKTIEHRLLMSVLAKPERIVASWNHPGQHRVCGQGICLVGEFCDGEFVIVTVYLDKVLTPPRPDQLLTPEGREYAARYATGLGRKTSSTS